MSVKGKRCILLLFGAVLSVTSLVSCATTDNEPLKTVETLDLDRYLGTWYEIARFQHRFEKDLVAVKAEYSMRDDGKIQVVNSGLKHSLDGPVSRVKAIAHRPDASIPGALKVRFFGLFSADYLVFGLDDVDYQWALVGSNNRKFLWFLSRTKDVSDETLQMMKRIALDAGYDLQSLHMVEQKK